MNGRLKEGYLMRVKVRFKTRTKRKRYFVLYSTRLTKYENPQDVRPLSVLNLVPGCAQVRAVVSKESVGPFVFRVTTPKDSIELQGTSFENMRGWIVALQLAVQKLSRGPAPSGMSDTNAPPHGRMEAIMSALKTANSEEKELLSSRIQLAEYEWMTGLLLEGKNVAECVVSSEIIGWTAMWNTRKFEVEHKAADAIPKMIGIIRKEIEDGIGCCSLQSQSWYSVWNDEVVKFPSEKRILRKGNMVISDSSPSVLGTVVRDLSCDDDQWTLLPGNGNETLYDDIRDGLERTEKVSEIRDSIYMEDVSKTVSELWQKQRVSLEMKLGVFDEVNESGKLLEMVKNCETLDSVRSTFNTFCEKDDRIRALKYTGEKLVVDAALSEKDNVRRAQSGVWELRTLLQQELNAGKAREEKLISLLRRHARASRAEDEMRSSFSFDWCRIQLRHETELRIVQKKITLALFQMNLCEAKQKTLSSAERLALPAGKLVRKFIEWLFSQDKVKSYDSMINGLSLHLARLDQFNARYQQMSGLLGMESAARQSLTRSNSTSSSGRQVLQMDPISMSDVTKNLLLLQEIENEKMALSQFFLEKVLDDPATPENSHMEKFISGCLDGNSDTNAEADTELSDSVDEDGYISVRSVQDEKKFGATRLDYIRDCSQFLEELTDFVVQNRQSLVANLEAAAIFSTLEKYLCVRIGDRMWNAMLVEDEDTVIHEKYVEFGDCSAETLLVPEGLRPTEERNVYESGIEELKKISEVNAPSFKLSHVLASAKAVFDGMNSLLPGNSFGSDDFIPVFIFVVLKAAVPHLSTELNYIRTFASRKFFFKGEMEYYSASLEIAVQYIRMMTQESLTSEMEEGDHNADDD